MKRLISEALAFALLLLAVQTATLAHEHEGDATPAGAAAQSCEFCVGHSAAAPAPEAAGVARPDSPALLLPATAQTGALAQRRVSAHRSRAPPTCRSL